MKENYFVKSFEEDFVLKTMHDGIKISSQSIKNIVDSLVIKPNTTSFGRKKRLACTYLSRNYFRTYRAQGFIFQTNNIPNHIYPFDLSVLIKNDNIVVNYYKIEKKLDVYYNYSLINGFEKFLFNDFNTMIKIISSPEVAFKKVNLFREDSGFKKLSKQKMKLLMYNEIVFEKNISIKPIAIYGYKKKSRLIAKELNLPHFTSAKNFYDKVLRDIKLE